LVTNDVKITQLFGEYTKIILNDVFGKVSARKPVESILIAKLKKQNPQAHNPELMGLVKS